MSDMYYVFSRMDAMSKVEIEHAARIGAMRNFIKACRTDCDLRLARIDCADQDNLVRSYNRIVTTREVYESMLAFFEKITSDKG